MQAPVGRAGFSSAAMCWKHTKDYVITDTEVYQRLRNNVNVLSYGGRRLRTYLYSLTKHRFARGVRPMVFLREWYPLLQAWLAFLVDCRIDVRKSDIGYGIYCAEHMDLSSLSIPGFVVKHAQTHHFEETRIHGDSILVGPMALLNYSSRAHYSLPCKYSGNCWAKWNGRQRKSSRIGEQLFMSYGHQYARSLNKKSVDNSIK